MNEPSDQAREIIGRYRDAIGPSSAERAALVLGVRQAIASGVGPSAIGTAGAVARRTPWLTIVGVATVIGGVAWWATRAPEAEVPVAAAVIEPAVAAPTDPDPPVIAANTATRTIPPTSAVNAPPPPPERAAPERSAVRRTMRSAAAPAAEVAEPMPSPEVTTVDAEVALLREASVALKAGENATARARYEEHARRFPAGALVELREVGLALLDCRADPAHATDRADRFAARFPGSPHLARIERECAR